MGVVGMIMGPDHGIKPANLGLQQLLPAIRRGIHQIAVPLSSTNTDTRVRLFFGS